MKPEYPLYTLAGVALVAVAVLSGLGDNVPAELWAIAVALITAAAGVTVPSSSAVAASVESLEGTVGHIIASVESLSKVVEQANAPPDVPPADVPVSPVHLVTAGTPGAPVPPAAT